MPRVAFVTDSAGAIPADQAQRYNITVAPQQVIFGTEVFRDGVDLTQDEFFARMRAARALPTTSQPTPGDLEAAYTRLIDDPDVGSIIGVHVSATLSGTYQAARTVAERLQEGTPKKITVLDSRSAYMGQGLMIIDGARAAEAGKGHDEVVQLIQDMAPQVQVLLLVDSIEHLQRGGRIGGAQAFVGGLLNIKPVLRLYEGRLEPVERVRTRRRAIERLVEIGAAETGGRPCQVCVGHAAAPEDFETFRRLVLGRLNVAEEFTSEVPASISTHVGPGVLGFVYYPLES